MPKNLISASEGGAVRINSNTPQHITSIGTDSIQTCIGVLLSGDRKLSLMHLDYRTSTESIVNEMREFGNISSIRIIINPHHFDYSSEDLVSKAIQSLEVTCPSYEQRLPTIKTNTDGAFVVEVDRDSWSLHPRTDITNVDITEKRSIYHHNLDKHRKSINRLNRVLLGTTDIDLQYDGISFQEDPKLNETFLQYINHFNDEDILSQITQEKYKEAHDGEFLAKKREFDKDNSMTVYLKRDELLPYFPYLDNFLSDAAIHRRGNIAFAQSIGDYLVSKKTVELMRDDIHEYNISPVDETKKGLLKDLTTQFRLNLEEQEQSNGTISCKATLPSSLLNSDLRPQLGIDRIAIVPIDEKQKQYLQEHIQDIVFEDYKKNPKKPVLLTFPLNSDAREKIMFVTNSNEWRNFLSTQEEAVMTSPSSSTSEGTTSQLSQQTEISSTNTMGH